VCFIYKFGGNYNNHIKHQFVCTPVCKYHTSLRYFKTNFSQTYNTNGTTANINFTFSSSVKQKWILQLKFKLLVYWFNKIIQSKTIDNHKAIDWEGRPITFKCSLKLQILNKQFYIPYQNIFITLC